MENIADHRFSLRVPKNLYQEMETLCHGSVNSWVAEAIREKIEKDSTPPPQRQAGSGLPFYEFFAGGGMARAGLGEGWDCLFANDFDPMKGSVYRKNWNGGHDLLVEDVAKVTTAQLPQSADLVWASFPCQDLSLAGNYRGIGHRETKEQTRSGTFWPFWKLMRNLMQEGRAPKLIVLENVYGALTSHQGKDFAAICSAYSGADYRFGALVIDAKHFVPQSRQRVFVVGVRSDVTIPKSLLQTEPSEPWHPKALQKAYEGLTSEAKKKWLWWNVPTPSQPVSRFADIIEEHPEGVEWHTKQETARILSLMSPLHLQKVEAAKKAGKIMVGGVYRRTREEDGQRMQRAEVRFDDIAGCLRTPSGGSSRQIILVVSGKSVRSRLLSPREAARLMGLSDTYWLPPSYNDAYHVAGDGVAVPVVRHLAENLFEKILTKKKAR